MFVPFRCEIQAALLNPAFEIARGNFVGLVQQRAGGIQELHRRFFHRDALGAGGEGIGADIRQQAGLAAKWIAAVGDVVLHHQRSAVLHVIQQPALIGAQIRAHVVGAHASDDGVEAAEIAARQIVRAQQHHVGAQLLQGLRHFVARAHHIADVFASSRTSARTSFAVAGGNKTCGGMCG